MVSVATSSFWLEGSWTAPSTVSTRRWGRTLPTLKPPVLPFDVLRLIQDYLELKVNKHG